MASPRSCLIRPAVEADLDRVAALWGEMYADQRAHGMTLALRDDAVEIWRRQQAGRVDTPVAVVLVAELADHVEHVDHAGHADHAARADGEASAASRIVGFLAAQTKRLPPHLAAAKPKVGFISELYVEPAARRHRVGRALVDAAFAWFTRADVGSVELHVLVDNAAGRAFWESVGFGAELLQMRAPLPSPA